MTKYKCGHETDGVIILDDSIVSLSGYLDWKDSVGLDGDRTKCWKCYCADSKPNTREKK